MSFTEKIDVLEMLIEIVKQHEEALDQITTRLEAIAYVVGKHYNEAK